MRDLPGYFSILNDSMNALSIALRRTSSASVTRPGPLIVSDVPGFSKCAHEIAAEDQQYVLVAVPPPDQPFGDIEDSFAVIDALDADLVMVIGVHLVLRRCIADGISTDLQR